MSFQLQNKSKFAVTALIDVALRELHGPVTLAEVGERQHISQTYLELIFKALRKGGLVLSARGPGEGYLLARPADQITVAEILRATSDVPGLKNRRRLSSSEGQRAALLDEAVHLRAVEVLGEVTLATLVQEQNAAQVTGLRDRLRPSPASITIVDPSKVANSVFDLAAKLL